MVNREKRGGKRESKSPHPLSAMISLTRSNILKASKDRLNLIDNSKDNCYEKQFKF